MKMDAIVTYIVYETSYQLFSTASLFKVVNFIGGFSI